MRFLALSSATESTPPHPHAHPALPQAVRFLALSSASVRHVESTHPASAARSLHCLRLPGAALIRISFDARSTLPRGACLALYLNAACTRQVLKCEGDDPVSAESLWLPTDRVYLHYTCPPPSRERAWGFKLRASAVRWRARTEGAALALPHEGGWRLLRLLAAEAPAALLAPRALGAMLRYLQAGKSPAKEELCDVLLRLLPLADAKRLHVDSSGAGRAFDWTGFRSLERLIEFHEELYERQKAPPLLPVASQAMLDVLLEVREALRLAEMPSWTSSLPYLEEVAELSALSKWLLANADTTANAAQSAAAAAAADSAPSSSSAAASSSSTAPASSPGSSTSSAGSSSASASSAATSPDSRGTPVG